MEKILTVSHKINIHSPYDPTGYIPNSLLDKYPREMKIYTHRDFYTNVEGNFIQVKFELYPEVNEKLLGIFL